MVVIGDRYEVSRELGQGAFGMVTLHHKPTTRGLTLWPLGRADVDHLLRVAKRANMEIQRVH